MSDFTPTGSFCIVRHMDFMPTFMFRQFRRNSFRDFGATWRVEIWPSPLLRDFDDNNYVREKRIENTGGRQYICADLSIGTISVPALSHYFLAHLLFSPFLLSPVPFFPFTFFPSFPSPSPTSSTLSLRLSLPPVPFSTNPTKVSGGAL